MKRSNDQTKKYMSQNAGRKGEKEKKYIAIKYKEKKRK